MKYIVCSYNMFDLFQSIYLVETDHIPQLIGHGLIKDLPDMLLSLCSQYETYKIKLFGNTDVLIELQEQIFNLNYANYPIEIEVN